MKRRNRIFSALCILVFLLSGCGSSSNTNSKQDSFIPVEELVKEAAGNEVMTTKATIMDIKKTILLDAQIDCTFTELRFSDTGKFLEYSYTLGDYVKKGEVIAYSDEKDLKEQVEDAREDLKNYVDDYNASKKECESEIEVLKLKLQDVNLSNMERMNQKLTIEEKELYLKHLKRQHAIMKEKKEHQLSKLKNKIGTNQIVAPHDGVIVFQRYIEKGSYISDEDVYIAISKPDEYYAVCDKINESTVKQAKRIYALKDGREYELTFQEPDAVEDAKRKDRNIDLHSKLLFETTDENIQFGDYAVVAIVISEANQVIGIPKITMKSDTVGKFVYVLENGEKVQRYIKIGIMDEVNVEVTEGLKEGDVIYVEN